MNRFLDQVFFDNTVRSYCIVLGIILLVLILKRFISRYIAGLLFKLIQRNWKNIDKNSFINLVVHPLGIFLVILISIIALHKLVFPHQLAFEIYDYPSVRVLHSLGTIAIIVSFIWLLLRIIDFIAIVLGQRANLAPDQADNQLIFFFKDFFKVIIVVFGILMIFHFAFNFRIGNLLTGLSIIGAAIALALRESIENLIASFIIFFDKPFTIGDLIRIQNFTGNVERIGLRSTRLRTEQKTYVTVPNKQMVDSILDNLSLRTQRRAELNLQLDLSTPSTKIEEFIQEIRKILDRKEIENSTVLLNDISSLAFLIHVEYFTSVITVAEFNITRQDVNMRLLKLMEELKIELAGASTEIRIT